MAGDAGSGRPAVVSRLPALEGPTLDGVVTLIVFPLLYVGPGLALVRRFRPPTGSLTVAFTGPAIAMSVAEFAFPLAYPALLAGVAGLLLSYFAVPGMVDRE